MLRHIGVTRRQIGLLLAREGALSALLGVVGGLVAGLLISVVLVEVVNRQSFHWSMEMHFPVAALLIFAAVIVALAAAGATFGGRQAMTAGAVSAVREDW